MSAETDTWTPAPDDVAALIPQRTGDGSGRASGSFSGSTVPSVSQVQDVINQVVAEVHGAIGIVDADLLATARRTVALGAASYVELSYFPDQNVGGVGPAAMLWQRYQTSLKALHAANVGGAGGADEPGPIYAFPTNADVPTPWPRITTMGERF